MKKKIKLIKFQHVYIQTEETRLIFQSKLFPKLLWISTKYVRYNDKFNLYFLGTYVHTFIRNLVVNLGDDCAHRCEDHIIF